MVFFAAFSSRASTSKLQGELRYSRRHRSAVKAGSEVAPVRPLRLRKLAHAFRSASIPDMSGQHGPQTPQRQTLTKEDAKCARLKMNRQHDASCISLPNERSPGAIHIKQSTSLQRIRLHACCNRKLPCGQHLSQNV